jgi:adenine-specific DNA-methyltransferase
MKGPYRAGEAKNVISSIKHPEDTRTNIPTEELRDFMAEDEKAPKTVLYPRDTSLDPQLVWRGKDEQDRQPLAVPSVPIYIQEKIHPQAIIENLRETAKSGGEPELGLFNDFNGIKFEDQIDFYHHQQNWQNRMILGDSLLVMNSLAEKEGLKGKVQMIYLDPPYGIKFGSNWQVSTLKRDVRDGKAEDSTRQPEQVKAFRDTWKLGVHSYLSYLFVVGHQLLTNSGSLFLQIGDENVHLVRSLLDEVFGTENFVTQISVKKTAAQTDENLSSCVDYVLWYAKDISHLRANSLQLAKELGQGYGEQYRWCRRDGVDGRISEAGLPEGAKAFRPDNLTSSHEYTLGKEPYDFRGRTFHPGSRYWTTSPDGFRRLEASNRLIAAGNTLSYVRILDDFGFTPLLNIWTDTGMDFPRISGQ